MTVRSLVNGSADARIDAHDRGLAYGDGLFETVLALDGKVPLWRRHMSRLTLGCRRLGLPQADARTLHDECISVIEGLDRAVVRITLTRGSGPRGYAPPAHVEPTRIVQAGPAPKCPPGWYHHGIRVHLCRMRLAAQPALAGLKHLNRLEQVLARSEWQEESIAEGLVCDVDGHVISATAANLFAVLDGTLVTPAVDACGVAGVARAEVLARRPDCVQRPIALDELKAASELFLTSSVRGILPIGQVPAWHQEFPVGEQARALQDAWQADGLMAEIAT